eukprot:TRINITY_DN1417_c0_g2_i1.p1 TRINITY_DN1417_c0_g2~~TRINITY_DN1417_c0_g2_i1.p1  ORF type:complete len:149 (+),score=18.86 TRINITY_DN1417_c0_g2_i1:25-471(+)
MADTGQTTVVEHSDYLDRRKAFQERRLRTKEKRLKKASQAELQRQEFERELRSNYTVQRAIRQMLGFSQELSFASANKSDRSRFNTRTTVSTMWRCSGSSELLHLQAAEYLSNRHSQSPERKEDQCVTQRRFWTSLTTDSSSCSLMCP